MIPEINYAVIDPVTGVAVSEPFTIFEPATISAEDLVGGETVAIEKQSGSNWVPVTNGQGDNTLTATDPVGYLRGPGIYRVSKTATTNPCGVYLN